MEYIDSSMNIYVLMFFRKGSFSGNDETLELVKLKTRASEVQKYNHKINIKLTYIISLC